MYNTISKSVVVVTCAVLVHTISSPSGAGVFTVGSKLDTHDINPGDGVALDEHGEVSLRAAIEEANALAEGSVIYVETYLFDGPYSHYATLPTPIVITDSVLIFFDFFTVLGNDSPISDSPVYPVRPFVIIENNASVQMHGLKITGFTVNSGGVIHISEGSELELTAFRLRSNVIGPEASAILNEGHLTIRGTITSATPGGGPGITTRGPSFEGYTDSRSSIPNAAPLLRIEDGDVQLAASFRSVAANVPALEILGGNVESSSLSFIHEAPAASMAVRGGTVSIAQASFENLRGENGGALEVTGGTVSVENATFMDSEAAGDGGAIFASNNARVWVRQATFSNNSAQGTGGAVHARDEAQVELVNCTITGNSAAAGAALQTAGNARITLGNTVIGGNLLLGSEPEPVSAIITSLGGNVVDGAAPGLPWLANDRVGTAENPLDLLLGPLVTSESGQRVHEPLAGSPAIDAADPALFPPTPNVMQFDQRRVGYRRVIGAGLDAGAAEFQDPNLTPHSLDIDGNFQIDLEELLRVIQFYNMPVHRYRCMDGTEDGYTPGGSGTMFCRPHDSDYNPQGWGVILNGVLRAIQFYNSPGYHPCPEGEDGFCAE